VIFSSPESHSVIHRQTSPPWLSNPIHLFVDKNTHMNTVKLWQCAVKKDSLQVGDKVDGYLSRVLNKSGMLAGLCNMFLTLEFDSGNQSCIKYSKSKYQYQYQWSKYQYQYQWSKYHTWHGSTSTSTSTDLILSTIDTVCDTK